MIEQAKRNTRILRRSQERELTLLQAPSLAELLQGMTGGLAQSYGLEQVTLVLSDPDHDIRHLLPAGGARAVEEIAGLIFVDGLAGLTPQYVALRKPWLGRFNTCDHQLIFPQASGIRSVALIPLIHQGTLFGSINFGSAEDDRFTPEHGSDFFAHLGIVASFALENAVNRARLRRSGFTDALTGWFNRRYLQLRMNEELARAQRDSTTLTCLMLDIDHFKRVNDGWGHAAGDRVLREIAQRVESQVRASDVAARYGGEEFVVLLPNTDPASAGLLAERVRRTIAASAVETAAGESLQITASIGIASVSPDPDERELKTLGESLLARADVALYNAKRSGRDRIEFEQDGNSAAVA